MKKVFLIVFCILFLVPQVSHSFNYSSYPALHQQYRNKLTTDSRNITRIKQLSVDPNADLAFGLRRYRYNQDTGVATEQVFPFSQNELTNQTARLQQLLTANQYLLDQNNTEFDEARTIYNTIQFKSSLISIVDAISTTVIDANCTAQINILRDAGYADIDALKEGASGNYLTALNSLRGYVGSYIIQLKAEITESNLISKIVQYKNVMATKVTAVINYDPAHTTEYNSFKAGHEADIDTLDTWCDAKIVLMASITDLKTSLTTAIDFEEESLSSDLTDVINAMEASITSTIDNFNDVDYSSLKASLLAVISDYEATL